MHSMFGNTYVCESASSTMKQVKLTVNQKSIAKRKLVDSLRLTTTNTGIDNGTIMPEKPRPQTSHWYILVINCYLLLCNNFNYALIYRPFCGFKTCECVALCIILLEVARELSCLWKIALRSKAVGERFHRQSKFKKTKKITGFQYLHGFEIWAEVPGNLFGAKIPGWMC